VQVISPVTSWWWCTYPPLNLVREVFPEIAMRHFVARHNTEGMGDDDEPNGEYAFLSRKALTFVVQTVGKRFGAFTAQG
jgi:hypothetical protein